MSRQEERIYEIYQKVANLSKSATFPVLMIRSPNLCGPLYLGIRRLGHLGFVDLLYPKKGGLRNKEIPVSSKRGLPPKGDWYFPSSPLLLAWLHFSRTDQCLYRTGLSQVQVMDAW
ncbi:hypothetical protein CEB3_c05660 [Peptococcaceae bacterium CEB3]|nr:hypothetical protein CEB3_c05660 [Peptococcaceae bacterium CEB3]